MQDPNKVRDKISELNAITPGQSWEEAEGYHFLTKIMWSGNGQNSTVLPASGIPVKVFVNTVTGELKIYSATAFESNSS